MMRAGITIGGAVAVVVVVVEDKEGNTGVTHCRWLKANDLLQKLHRSSRFG